MLGGPSYAGQAAAYAYAGVAMAGPWLLTSLYMHAVNILGIGGLTLEERATFQALVLYGYCGSMLLTGAFQLVVARHVSDKLFVGQGGQVVPCYAGNALVTLALHLAAAAVFVAASRPPPLLAGAELAFFGSLGLVWNGMIFLGTIRNYMYIVVAFVAGIAASGAAAAALAAPLGVAGMLLAFSAGQALTVALLSARLRAEFPADGALSFSFFRTFRRFPSLLFIGLAYTGGIWIDKLIFWAGPYAYRLPSGLTSFPLYDNAVFLAYLTVVPALALVFVRVEVSFYHKYRRFFGAIRHGAELEAVGRARRQILASFDESLRRIAGLQGTVTLLVVLFAPRVLEGLGLDWVQYYIFRVACLGAFLQVIILTLLLAALHLALYRPALGMTLTYFLTGAAATVVTAILGLETYGYGFLAAGLAALAVGFPWIRRLIRTLDVRTFMDQAVT
jgi:uncharacterized membrane protein